MSPTKYVGGANSFARALRTISVATAVVGMILLILGTTGTGSVAAQDVEINETYGGTGTDTVFSVVETSDGGYALAGRTESFGPDGGYAPRPRDTDAWLMKTDSNGKVEFSKTYGGDAFDVAYSVVETSDGGFALAGNTGSFGSDDAWLIKTDENGNEIFNKTFGGESSEDAYSVVETSDGGFALTGFTVSFGTEDEDASESFDEGPDAWLIKTDENGNVEINETYGKESHDVAESVVQTSGGGYVLAGVTESFGSGAWLVKTDTNGNEEFNETFSGADKMFSVIETSDEGYAMAGATAGLGSESSDVCLIKTDSDGNIEFNKAFGGEKDDRAFSVVETSDGGFAMAGRTNSSGSSSDDMGIVKTDTNGDVEFSKAFGGKEFDVASSVIEASDGSLVLVGETNSFGSGSSDAWLLKVSTDSDGGSDGFTDNTNEECKDSSTGSQGMPGFTVLTALLVLVGLIAAIAGRKLT